MQFDATATIKVHVLKKIHCTSKKQTEKKSVSAAWLWIVYDMAICKICRILYQADYLNIFHLWKEDYMISHDFSPQLVEN